MNRSKNPSGPTRWLRISLIAFALCLFASPSAAAPPAQVGADLCALIPAPAGVVPRPGLLSSRSAPLCGVESSSIGSLGVYRYASVEEARSYLADERSKADVPWVSSSRYGDAGFGFDIPEGAPIGTDGRRVHSAGVEFSRGCIIVSGYSNLDPNSKPVTNLPRPPEALRDLAQQVDQRIQAQPPCPGSPPVAKPTATPTTPPPKLLSLLPLGDVVPAIRNDADPFAVYPGDKVKVTGVVYAIEGFDGIFPKFPRNVQAQVEISQGFNSIIQKITTDAQGYYEAEYLVVDDRASVIVVNAISPDPSRYETGERQYSLDLKKRGSLTVTAATDKAVYAPGEPVTVSGNVIADGKQIDAIIGFRSDILPLTSLTSSSGRFQFTFTPGQEPKRDLLGPFQNGLHVASAQATLLGYDNGSASAAYLVEQPLVCTSLSAQVVDVTGVARVLPVDPSSLQLGSDLANAVALSNANASRNTKLTQGLKVQTEAGGRVAIRFEGADGAVATVAVNDATTLQIQTFCKDKATGKIQAVLVVDGPGQVAVNKTTTGSIFSNIDIAVVTRSVRVKSINTRYFVGVDSQGKTTVAALEGTVIVSAPDSADGIELPALKRIAIAPAEKPEASKIAALDGKIDPRLEGMLDKSPSAARAASPNSPIATLPANPLILIGVTGFALVGFGGLILGLLLVARSRRKTGFQARPKPTDLPELGQTRDRSRPTDLPR